MINIKLHCVQLFVDGNRLMLRSESVAEKQQQPVWVHEEPSNTTSYSAFSCVEFHWFKTCHCNSSGIARPRPYICHEVWLLSDTAFYNCKGVVVVMAG